jgi:CheY-like chemotaxis protein
MKFVQDHGMPVPREMTSRLLLIDDDETFLRTTKRLLHRRAAHVVVATADGPIVGLLKVGTWLPDAVLLDAYMPGMDGVEVCRRIRSCPETAHILVVALTGRPSPDVASAFREAGAAACLVKPLNAGELMTALGWSGAVFEEVVR